jgi:spermidine synthase
VRFLLFAILIVGPSTLIGGTLVVLSRALVRNGHSGEAVGALYAVNTAGAVCGTLAPDFALAPFLGLTAAAVIASAGNLLVAALARAFDEGPLAAAAAAPPAPEPAPEREPGAGPALALYAISGFCAMGAEVLWSRTLSHWVSALSTSFAVLLAVFLSAIALGSWSTRALADRVSEPLAWAAAIVAAIGPAILLPLAFASRWRDLARELWPLGEDLRRSMWAESLDALIHSVYLQGAACVLMGAAFPLLAAASVREGRSGRQVGRLYAANCMAGVLGSITVGFLWLPTLGELDAFLAIACVPSLGAALVALRSPRSAGRWSALAAVPTTIALLSLLPADALHRAHFKRDVDVVALREGATTTAVAAHAIGSGCRRTWSWSRPGCR